MSGRGADVRVLPEVPLPRSCSLIGNTVSSGLFHHLDVNGNLFCAFRF